MSKIPNKVQSYYDKKSLVVKDLTPYRSVHPSTVGKIMATLKDIEIANLSISFRLDKILCSDSETKSEICRKVS